MSRKCEVARNGKLCGDPSIGEYEVRAGSAIVVGAYCAFHRSVAVENGCDLVSVRQKALDFHASEVRRLMGLPRQSPWKSQRATEADHPSFAKVTP